MLGRGAATLAIAVVLLALTAGCAARPLPGASGPGSPFGVGQSPVGPPDLVFVIPTGTAAAQMRGEPIFTIPSELTVLSGQSIVIRNDDRAMHYFAEAPIAPGQTYRKTFDRRGAFGYGAVLSCSIAERRTLTVRVVDSIPADGATPSEPPRGEP